MPNVANEDYEGTTPRPGRMPDYWLNDASGEFENIHQLRVAIEPTLTTTIRGQLFPQGNAT